MVLGVYVSPICSPSGGVIVSEDGISENNLKRKDMELDDCLGTSEGQHLRIA